MSEIIQVMTYDQWEEKHKQKQKRAKRKRKNEMMKMQRYFLKQRLYGLLILLLGVAVGCIANLTAWDNLFWLGALIVLGGLYVLVTRQMVIVDGYFLEIHK